jgi:hypothetical protein
VRVEQFYCEKAMMQRLRAWRYVDTPTVATHALLLRNLEDTDKRTAVLDAI